MTEVENSGQYDLEERILGFVARNLRRSVILAESYRGRRRNRFGSFGFRYCLGFRASDLVPAYGSARGIKEREN